MDDLKAKGDQRVPQRSLADRADDGFVGLVRAAGSAVRRIEVSSARGVGRIARTLKRDKPSEATGDEASEGLGVEAALPAQDLPPNPYDAPPKPYDAAPKPYDAPATKSAAEDWASSEPAIAQLESSARFAGRSREPDPEPAPEREHDAPRATDPMAGSTAGRAVAPAASPTTGGGADRAAREAEQRFRAASAPEGSSGGSPLALPMLDAKSLLESHPLRDRLPDREQLLPVVQKLLHGTHDVRRSAKRTLVRLGGAVAEPILVAVLRGATPELADVVLEGLSDLRSPRCRGCVAAVIAAHDVEMRLVALRAAQRLPGDAARSFFAHASLDSEPAVRRRAVLYLSWRGTDWAASGLRALCEDRDVMVRIAALRCLASAHPAMAREVIGAWGDRAGPLFRRFIVGIVGGPETSEEETDRASSVGVRQPESAAVPAVGTTDSEDEVTAPPPAASGRVPAAVAVADGAPSAEGAQAAAEHPAEATVPRVMSAGAAAVSGGPRSMKAEESALVDGRTAQERSRLLSRPRKGKRRPR